MDIPDFQKMEQKIQPGNRERYHRGDEVFS